MIIIFDKAIDSVLATTSPSDAIRTAADAITALLPTAGLIAPDVKKPVTVPKTPSVKSSTQSVTK